MKRFCIIILSLWLVACEKQIDYPLQSENLNLLVVSGSITSEKAAHEIVLSRSAENINQPFRPVAGAGVLISDGINTYTLKEVSARPGVYITDSLVQGIPGREYSLIVSLGQEVYTARCRMMPPEPFTRLKYKKKENSNLFTITWVANPYNAVKPAMYQIILDWSHLPAYQGQNPESCKATIYYYSLPTIDVSEIFAPEAEKVLFPAGTIVRERRYSLSSEHANYLRAMLSETNWRGGLFDIAAGPVIGNISNNGAGFFGACGLSEIQFVVTP